MSWGRGECWQVCRDQWDGEGLSPESCQGEGLRGQPAGLGTASRHT